MWRLWWRASQSNGKLCLKGPNTLYHSWLKVLLSCSWSQSHWWNLDIILIYPISTPHLLSINLEHECGLTRFLTFPTQSGYCFTKGRHHSSLPFIHSSLIWVISRWNFSMFLKYGCHPFLLLGIEVNFTQQPFMYLFTIRQIYNECLLCVGHYSVLGNLLQSTESLYLSCAPLLMSHIIRIILGEIELCCHNLSWKK